MHKEDQPLTLSVPAAGRRYYGLSRNGSYAAAARGDIPTIRIGKLLRFPIVACERRLEEAGRRAGEVSVAA
jgi:hypothetical protein